MIGLTLLVRRELRLAFRGGTDAMMGVIFFVLAAILFPFGVGPDAAILPRIGGGIIWVVALLAALLSLERMFAADHEDGSLDLLYLSPVSLGQLALAKAIAHWLTSGVLLLIASPVLALLYNLPSSAFLPLVATMALGTPTLSLVGAIGAALTLGARRGGVLLALLLLPLYIPVLIFGAGAIDGAIAGRDIAPQLMILGGFLLAALALAPWATAAALRQAIE
ncbi:MAG: heme exporter protein CcmB [Rhodospirillaceae bacterium]|jgi:heme exporter protein B|nr:heme exporter protein CcmB [Rhodospirillaceae bacterium]MBT3930951.1 heme exporter protein CcmB [Rhodospirillaceae bacterium]MBT4773053.1 heme exporter protein CcmB [Rhodospirillaceae bacterium]MBT5357014.1 heme exporter protein CcmB [Rhodospirillaceae bacterium]MBT5769842.1 heme exporter protein CcmB [Rhodospirillaceae bacterium]